MAWGSVPVSAFPTLGTTLPTPPTTAAITITTAVARYATTSALAPSPGGSAHDSPPAASAIAFVAANAGLLVGHARPRLRGPADFPRVPPAGRLRVLPHGGGPFAARRRLYEELL